MQNNNKDIDQNISKSKTISSYINIINKTEDLSEEREQDYIFLAKKGDAQAKEKLFNSYFKQVVSMARKYATNSESLEDLIGEGIRGLEKTLEKFEPARGNRFSTYSRFWIRAYMADHFRRNLRAFETPMAISGRLFTINKSIEKLSHELGRQPTDKEICEHLNLGEGYTTFLRKYLLPHCHLDSKISENDDRTISDNFPDNHYGSPRDSLIRDDGVQKIKIAMEKLTDKERNILERRYGLNGREEETLGEIGKDLQVSLERIRQIQSKAEAKLKFLINR